MSWMQSVAVVGVLAATIGCGSDRPRTGGSDAGVLTFDAAMIDGRDGGGRDAGSPVADGGPADSGTTVAACDDLPPATTTPTGVRTAHPHITVYDGSGFATRSVSYIVTEDGDSRGPLLEVFAEVENTGFSRECDFLPDAYLGGTELVGLVEAPPHFGEYVDSVTNDCLGPGQTGVFGGLARGVTEADVAAASSLSLDLSPSTIGDSYPATNGPTVLRRDVVPNEDGWGIGGEIRIETTIRNYNMTTYAIDDRGLITAELQSYPRELETLYAGETIAYHSLNGAPCEFTDHLSFQSWIVGAASGFAPRFAFPSDVDVLQAERREAIAELRRVR